MDESINETHTNIYEFENNLIYNSNSGEKIVYNGIDDGNNDYLYIQHRNNDYYPSVNRNLKEKVNNDNSEGQ